MKTEDLLNIPVRFERFPEGYVNDIRGWAFTEQEIRESAGQLLTLDIDFGTRCSLNCPFCFRRDNSVDDRVDRLGFEDTLQLLREAKALGLRSAKFLGAGEPLETSQLLELIREMHSMEIVPLLFTKGHVIGDDSAVDSTFGRYGVHTGEQLVDELYTCDVSVMLGLNTFDDSMQLRMIERKESRAESRRSYIEARNKALMLLLDRGFAEDPPTRLAIAVNPITTWNVHDAYDVYEWARRRNMYAIVTPPMVSGRSKRRLRWHDNGGWEQFTPPADALIDLYVKIYSFNLQTGLQTLDQISREGVSAYAGGHPCNQVACGLYVTLNGIVLSCPGSEDLYEGNYHHRPLKEIWLDSSNKRRRAGRFNCGCIAKDGKTIPSGLYDDVLKRLMEKPQHGG